MGVLVRVDAYVPGTVNPAKAFRSAFERVSELARRLSTYRDDSEVREIERWAWQEAVPVSQEFALVLGHALRLAQASNGAFDPTVGPVTRLIRTHGRQREGPGPTAIQAAWGRAGWKHVELDERARTVFLRRRGVQFDFGGIAKGYIADEALRTLAREGISRAIVSVAGDIAVGDPPPDADGWRIALDSGHLGDGTAATQPSGRQDRRSGHLGDGTAATQPSGLLFRQPGAVLPSRWRAVLTHRRPQRWTLYRRRDRRQRGCAEWIGSRRTSHGAGGAGTCGSGGSASTPASGAGVLVIRRPPDRQARSPALTVYRFPKVNAAQQARDVRHDLDVLRQTYLACLAGVPATDIEPVIVEHGFKLFDGQL